MNNIPQPYINAYKIRDKFKENNMEYDFPSLGYEYYSYLPESDRLKQLSFCIIFKRELFLRLYELQSSIEQ